MVHRVSILTSGQGLHEITRDIEALISEANCEEGLCTVMITHTSASLVIQENADPSARNDLERWFERLVPEADRLYTHRSEGPDDMPAHIKAALTATSLSIPVTECRLGLGKWQGIYLWEHRRRGGERRLLVHLASD